MARYDLTSKIGPYLDRHLVLPLIEFLQKKELYPEEDIMKAKLDLLSKTDMVDFALEVYSMIHKGDDARTEEMKKQRVVVLDRLKELQHAAEPLVNLLLNSSLSSKLRPDPQWNRHMLREELNISSDQIESLHLNAKAQFECGNYGAAGGFLEQYRPFASSEQKALSALWGCLAAQILCTHWGQASDTLGRVREAIDAMGALPGGGLPGAGDTLPLSAPAAQLRQRLWLLHWSLFIFFNSDGGVGALVEMFMNDRYLNAVQSGGQHLLRYLAAAVVMSKRRRGMMKDVVRIIQQEKTIYSDPITELLDCLQGSYDFETAAQKLRECEDLLRSDYFLASSGGLFLEEARQMLFENYSRLHTRTTISALAGKLGMPVDVADQWIVNGIRSARLDAKIDLETGVITMTPQLPSVYEQIIDKTKSLTYRTYTVSSAFATAARAGTA